MHSTRCYSLLGSTVVPMALALLLAVSLTACDQSSQNFDYTSGSNLTVDGPASLTIPNYDSTVTGEYMVRAFTIEQNYNWSVEGGASLEGTQRDGEVAVVSTSTPGSYTVTVETTIDGETYTGTASTTVDYPSAVDQAAKYNLNIFSQVGTSTGLVGQLNSGLTVFAPSDPAFLGALDASGNGELEDSETPAPGVLSSILRYHAGVDSLTSSEISDGSTVATTLHPEEILSFSVNGGITVQGAESSAEVVASDIATAEGVVLHKVDGVLLPSSVVSINAQTVSRDTVNNVDTVAVEGTYVVDGGFVALHDSTRSGDIIGVSEKLDPGFHGNEAPIKIALDSQISDTTGVVAMPHRDTDGDDQFTFNPSLGTDVPYFRGDSNVPVVDSASVAPPQ